MFQQVAYNLAKMGFYPTDEQTLACITRCIAPNPNSRWFDPCCGEGVALATLGNHCQGETVGIELDADRATAATGICNTVVHADVHDCLFPSKATSGVFLNPPYGAEDSEADCNRIEKTFIRRTLPTVMAGGLVVIVIPHCSIDRTFAQYLARQLESVTVGLSPEQRFKQAIVIGRKRAAGQLAGVSRTTNDIVRAMDNLTGFPTSIDTVYQLPDCPAHFPIAKHSASADDVRRLLQHTPQHTLWGTLKARFAKPADNKRSPLMPLSDWHLSLALSSGQIAGIVDNGKRRLLVKGTTVKKQHEQTDVDPDTSAVKTTLIDRFVPVINALDVQPDSKTFGQLISIA